MSAENKSKKGKCQRPVSCRKTLASMLTIILALSFVCCANQATSQKLKAQPDTENVDPFMGDYWGAYKGREIIRAQMVPLGDDRYRAKFFKTFEKRSEPIVILTGRLFNNKLRLQGNVEDEGVVTTWRGEIKNNQFNGTYRGKERGSFRTRKYYRIPPTLKAKPAENAIVLFNGNDLDKWEYAKPSKKNEKISWKVSDGVIEIPSQTQPMETSSIATKQQFSDFKLHLEFRTPYMPNARGEEYGDSGVCIHQCYELQILDSYGSEGLNKDCGAIYGLTAPSVNYCLPPMQWQTYDIEFYAPRFDKKGEKTHNARITVLHNGKKIHDNVEIPQPTVKDKEENLNEAPAGNILLQNRGCPVQFRNIWLIEL